MTSIDIQELKRLYYDEQMSGYEIAQHFQTTPLLIYDRMRKHGLQRRTALDGQKLRFAKTKTIPNIDEIARLYFDEKLTLAEVGTRIGVCRDTVRKRLGAAGYKCRTKGESRHPRIKGACMFTASDLTEIQRLYCKAGLSADEIAGRYDCSSPTIRRHLKRQGVRLRTIPDAQALRRKHEQTKADDQHQRSVSRQLKELSPLPLEEVTPARVLELRHKSNLTIDAIAEVCSLTNLEVYNILQGG